MGYESDYEVELFRIYWEEGSYATKYYPMIIGGIGKIFLIGNPSVINMFSPLCILSCLANILGTMKRNNQLIY